MKYVLTLTTSNDTPNTDLGEAKKAIGELIEQYKPEATYFSTIRRFTLLIVNVEDPHVELRLLFETLSKWGNVTIDPVSTVAEFNAFLDKITA